MSADIIKLPDRAPKQPSSGMFAPEGGNGAKLEQLLPVDKEATYVTHLLKEAETLNELLIDLEHLLPDDGAALALRETRQAVVAMIVRARQALDSLEGRQARE